MFENRFDAIKTVLRLGANEPLVRTEEMVQSNTANLPISNGTLFLTDRYLLHQVVTKIRKRLENVCEPY